MLNKDPYKILYLYDNMLYLYNEMLHNVKPYKINNK